MDNSTASMEAHWNQVIQRLDDDNNTSKDSALLDISKNIVEAVDTSISNFLQPLKYFLHRKEFWDFFHRLFKTTDSFNAWIQTHVNI